MKVDKLDISKLVNVQTGLNTLITKVDNLDIDKLKNVPVDLEKLSYVVSKEVVKKPVCNKLNTKINNLENKILDVSLLVQTNKYNAVKQSLKKKNEDIENKIPDFVV